VASSTKHNAVRLEATQEWLPDAELSLRREPRLFSRTLALVVASEVSGEGPATEGVVELRKGRWGRGSSLRWRPAAGSRSGDASGEDWARRFTREGVLTGADLMTSVQSLTLRWAAGPSVWRLELVTLAGALIGTSPSTQVAVPMEAEDVDGLLAILRALAAVG